MPVICRVLISDFFLQMCINYDVSSEELVVNIYLVASDVYVIYCLFLYQSLFIEGISICTESLYLVFQILRV